MQREEWLIRMPQRTSQTSRPGWQKFKFSPRINTDFRGFVFLDPCLSVSIRGIEVYVCENPTRSFCRNRRHRHERYRRGPAEPRVQDLRLRSETVARHRSPEEHGSDRV